MDSDVAAAMADTELSVQNVTSTHTDSALQKSWPHDAREDVFQEVCRGTQVEAQH